MLKPEQLRCEYLENPLAIDEPRPRLSWILQSIERGRKQSAYQVLVAATAGNLAKNRGDLWNSGRVRNDQSVHVVYGGRKLQSCDRCHWKVRAWDNNGKPGPWSKPAFWEMGLLRESDWKAKWIGCAEELKPVYHDVPPSPVFRHEFTLAKPVKSARVYICGLGYYKLFLNDRQVGDHALDPAFTKYDRRVLYVAHDIAKFLKTGRNAIGVMLGNGWYNAHTRCNWNFDYAPWRDLPKLLLQARIEFDDGTIRTIGSDDSWKASSGPIMFDGLRNGEIYDAREEKSGWDKAGYDDRFWHSTLVTRSPGGIYASQKMPPIRVIETIKPAGVSEVKPGVFVFDMGQMFSGWAKLTVRGPAGATVTMRYSERLGAGGDIDTSNMDKSIKSGSFQTDMYILKGQGLEEYEPSFTYHGFQFVQVSGFPGKPTLSSLLGRVAHTALGRQGEFACSNDLLNRIQRLVLWSTRCNYHGIPTDCPHREKNGWTGDAMLSAEQALYNFDAASSYTKWMEDFRDEQRPSGQLPGIVPTGGWGYNWGSGPAWDSTYTHIPWYLYRYRGDLRILARHYAGMKRYLEFMTTMATGHIVSFGLGDWCPPRARQSTMTPVAVTSTGYYYANARILANAAKLLGKSADAGKFERLARQIKKAFIARFYNKKTGTITGEQQTSLACALYQGLLDPPEAQKTLAALEAEIKKRDYHIDCGILGAKYVMHALHDHGRDDLACAIATRKGYPGWEHWIASGATTLWETWEGEHSRIHHMFSDIGAWFYRALAGIDLFPDQPGFKRFIVRPSVAGDITWARAAHCCPYGWIRNEWRRTGKKFMMNVTIPPNTTAEVHLPAKDAAAATESGRPAGKAPAVRFLRMENNRAVFDVGSGRYRFASRI